MYTTNKSIKHTSHCERSEAISWFKMLTGRLPACQQAGFVPRNDTLYPQSSTKNRYFNVSIMTKKENIRIIGIDPGYGRIGWGIIDGCGSDWSYVAHGCIETEPKDSLALRIFTAMKELRDIIRRFNPTHAGIEQIFFFKNTKTVIAVAEARGACLLTLIEAGLTIDEFTPLQIKQALTGYGRAEKSQVQKMVQLQLSLKEIPKQDDAADALAVAITFGITNWLNSAK